MTRGGARARSGPPPDPMALRRDRDRGDWVRLPASGREGDIPDWPLGTSNARELRLWAEEWRRPQAVMWDARGQQLEVALYVRAVVVSEGRKATAADRGLVLRYMDDLGVSQGGLAKNHWTIVLPEVPTALRPTGTDAPSARDRFTLVSGGEE